MAVRRGKDVSVRRTLVVLVGLALVLGVLALWIMPALLTLHPSAGISTADRFKAQNDVRASCIAFLIVVGTGGTLWFTGWTYQLNRDGAVTERYTKAVGQLGDASSAVRVGGIYALERIGNDSDRDRGTILYVLGAFVRERSRTPRERDGVAPEDVLAGVRVAGRLLRRSEVVFDLRGADLRNVDLSKLPRHRVRLDGADTTGAVLPA